MVVSGIDCLCWRCPVPDASTWFASSSIFLWTPISTMSSTRQHTHTPFPILTDNANLPLTAFPSLVWSKHRMFLTSPCFHSLCVNNNTKPKTARKSLADRTKNYIQLFTTEMWYLQINTFPIEESDKKHANLSSRNDFHACVIWHFIDLNIRKWKTSGSPHTIFVRSCKTIGRSLLNFFSKFPTAKSR